MNAVMKTACITALSFVVLSTHSMAGNFTYTLHRAAEPTQDQADAYRRIEAAMDSAVYYYNTYTSITKHLNVHYNTDVPTADGNFNGTIRFGARRTYMVVATSMHEIAHTVGIGTTSEYRNFIQNGKFTGTHATEMLRELSDDPGATLSGDNQHFWPHGLNHADEASSEDDLIDHCLMVNAIYKDLFNEEFYKVCRLRSRLYGSCMAVSGDDLVLGDCSDSSSLVTMISLGGRERVQA